ncbi:MAG: hypothetical protein ABSF94_05665 [Steroidobacteraceae bacterium]|jgi:hypothetical protein
MRIIGLLARLAPMLWLPCTPAFTDMSLCSSDSAAGDAMPSAQIYPRCGGVKPSKWSHGIVINLPPGTNSLPRQAIDASAHPPKGRSIAREMMWR